MYKKIRMFILAVTIVIFTLGHMTSSYAIQNDEIYKLKPKYLTTNFNFDMMAATVTDDDQNFISVGNFRTDKDLAGMTWSSEDTMSHSDLKYPTDSDFTNVVLEYNYSLSGFTEKMDSTTSPVLTIETNSGDFYYVRLWNYVVDRPVDSWENGASDYYGTNIRFPEGRSGGNATGDEGKIIIDFNNLYSGWAPYYWRSHYDGEDEFGTPMYSDEWVPSSDWNKVPVNDIKKIMWSFVPEGYNWATNDISYLDDSYTYNINFSNWQVYGNTFLMNEPESLPIQQLRLCDDYDDIYNLTPERVLSEYDKLGYGEIVNFYIGASHYYDKKHNGQEMEMKTDYPFNLAFETWYRAYVSGVKERNMELIHSISVENVDAPEEWWQRTYDGTPASTMWQPTPHLLSFTNTETKTFLKNYALQLAKLSYDEGLKPMIQLGEPWWWFIETEEAQPPCFYDQSTKDLFMSEMGYPMHEFASANESIEGHEDMLYWLRDQNGKLSHYLRDAIKSVYPEAEFTVLFFTPSVIDEDRVPPMMNIVNFPQEYWSYPNLDFFMIEDYDYLITDEMDKHLETLTFAQDYLDYPEEKIHYFSGFVLNSDYAHVWENIEQAINNGYNQGFEEVYLWAYAQLKRDGWTPPDIIYASSPSGTYTETQRISLSSQGADEIRYTLDGSNPTDTSGFIYEEPVYIDSSKLLRTTAIKNGQTKNIVDFKYNMPSIKIPIRINVDGNTSEWIEIISLAESSGTIKNLYSVQNNQHLYLLGKGSDLNTASNFYIDADNNKNTGYQLWCWKNSGADYMVEENMIKRYIGDGSNWAWEQVGLSNTVKNEDVIEVSVPLESLGIDEPKEIRIGYGRNYSDYAPAIGKLMATSSNIILDEEDILVSMDYITSPLESSKKLTARVSVDGGSTDVSRQYYAQVFCSWDNETWYSKGGKVITIPQGQQSQYTDIDYSIFLSGDLYSKVVVYEEKYGPALNTFVRHETDSVSVGIVDRYDWYKFSDTDSSGVAIEGYISDIGGYAGETTETIYTITKRSDEDVWRQSALENGVWTTTSAGTVITYPTNPIEPPSENQAFKSYSSDILLKATTGSATTFSYSTTTGPATKIEYNMFMDGNAKLATILNIKDIQSEIELKIEELVDQFYAHMGIDPRDLDEEDVQMILGGLGSSVDDNMFFGATKWLTHREDHEENYYFMKAKSFGDACFTAGYTTATVGSAAEAIRALNTAGAAGAMAIASAPTGVGTPALGTVAVVELGEAAVMSSISYISGNMAERSQDILKESVDKLKETLAYKIRSVGDDILIRFEGYKGGHTKRDHVSQLDEDLFIQMEKKKTNATSYNSMTTATKSVQHNLKKNADDIVDWVNNSTNNSRKAFDVTHRNSVGYGVAYEANTVTYNLTKSRIVLVRDDSVDIGFYILTSFPLF